MELSGFGKFMMAKMLYINRNIPYYVLLILIVSVILLTNSLATATPQLQAKTYDLPQGVIHTLLIPRSNLVTIAQSPGLATVKKFAQKLTAKAVLNGGFFDPQNQLSTSYIIQNGKITGEPRDNPRLVNNPDLAPYLPLILNRSEFRRYQCGVNIQYDIVKRDQPIPLGCDLVDALGGGPQLLPELTSIAEGFTAYQGDELIRDAIGINQPNARTAIAVTPRGDLLWIIVTQKNALGGLSLEELATFCRNLGVKKALNLDGGSSTSLYWDGNSYYGKVSDEGEEVIRPIKSVLVLAKN